MSLAALLWVLNSSEATLGSRLVLLALADNADDEGANSFPSVATIARKARMSEKGAREALRRLERSIPPLIRQTGVSRWGTNVYEILGVGDNSVESGENGGEEVSLGGKLTDDFGTRASPELSLERSLSKSSSSKTLVEYLLLADAWLEYSPPLARHRPAYFEKPSVQTAVKKALKVYPAEDVVAAIANYRAVVASPDHFWSHRWTFQEFLDRGLDKFVAEADPLGNFRTGQNTDRKGGQQGTPHYQLAQAEAWILETAWRLPLDEGEVAEMLGRRGVEGPDRTRLLGLWRSRAEAAA